MIFRGTQLAGVHVVFPECDDDDERGSFSRTFCSDAFRAVGADPNVAQCSISKNRQTGTLRGLHLQSHPHGETKLVRCITGEVFDVAADLRADSPTFGQHHAEKLSAANGMALLIPPGVAHGFMTLVDDTTLWYQMSVPYNADVATGVRWDDDDLGILWPGTESLKISERDRDLPGLAEWTRAQ